MKDYHYPTDSCMFCGSDLYCMEDDIFVCDNEICAEKNRYEIINKKSFISFKFILGRKYFFHYLFNENCSTKTMFIDQVKPVYDDENLYYDTVDQLLALDYHHYVDKNNYQQFVDRIDNLQVMI